jgi:hypothetical protein
MGLLRAHMAAGGFSAGRSSYRARHAAGIVRSWYPYYEGRHRA